MKGLSNVGKLGLEWVFFILKMFHYLLYCYIGLGLLLLAKKLDHPAMHNCSLMILALLCIALFTMKLGFRKKEKNKKVVFSVILGLATLLFSYSYLSNSHLLHF